jgi:hypothetical protein
VPGLEIHTLDHIDIESQSGLLEGVYWDDLDLELDELMLERARAAAVGAIAPIVAEKAPEQSGAFSLGEAAVYSVLGDRLADIESMLDKKERLAMYPIALGSLASASTLSMTTGCWSIIDAWRDEKGYAFVWKPEEYGYSVDRTGDFRGISVHRMAYNMKRRLTGQPDLNRYQQLDHICRWPGCCNIDHLAIVDHKKNNRLRDQARQLEAAITTGQIILGPSGIDWLDDPLESAPTEDTDLLISTPSGPYRIIKLDDSPLMFRGEAVKDELQEKVAPPAPKKYERPSRARRKTIHKEQRQAFKADGYGQRRRRKADLYKNWQKTGQF